MANGALPAPGYPAVLRHAWVRPYLDSLGASPSLLDWPSAAYGVNAIRDSADWAEKGGCGLPTLGVLTATSGPLGALAVHAARPTQQQVSRPVPRRIVVPFTRDAGPRVGWSWPRGARGRHLPAGRRRCR